MVTHDQEHSRCKDAYLQAFEKFEKHRENQKKIMEKIEKGNKAELEKYIFSWLRFNLNTKKLTENISVSEKNYVDSVELVNKDWYKSLNLGKMCEKISPCIINRSFTTKIQS